ncbi:MAG TPA: ABC transporter permease [Vicinamibacterales bacterium]|nr:ABC transporter permease [Vicinamibacterales bacterium]
MATLLQDLKYAVRSLRRAPGFALVVILTLALGIGANTSIFSIVYAVVLRPLPYAQPQQLVRITSELGGLGASDTGMAALELFDYQARTDLFSGVAGLYPINANLTGGEQPERVEVMLVSPNYFSILGAAPQLGRAIGPQDDGPGIPEIAVVSDGYWRRRLGADPNAIGRTVMVDGDPFVIVGVMPPGFRHPGRTVETDVDLWSPAGYRSMPFPDPTRTRRMLQGAVARLQPGVTIDQAQARLDAYAADMRSQFPSDYPAKDGWRPRLVPLHEDVVDRVAATMWILLSAVGLLLLVACVNVANLILTRASERRQEIAIRRALGASQVRLARQMITESAVLATAGGALGLLLAAWGIEALVALAPSRVPRLGEVSLDAAALVVATVLAGITTVLFGAAPAWQMRRSGTFAAAKEGGPGRSAGAGRTRVRHALVTTEVALAMVLLVGAGLFVRSVGELLTVPLGFDAQNLLTARVWLPRPNDAAAGVYLRPENRVTFYRETLRRVRMLPGVERAAMSTQVPMGGYNPPIFFELDGVDPASRPTLHNFQVSPGYFETMGIPVTRGRDFSDADRQGAEPVAIVSEAAVRLYWPGRDPIGSRIRLSPQAPWMTIIGVAGDVRHRRLDDAPQPMLYRSLEQSSNLTLALLLRTSGDRPGLAEAVSREVRAVDPNLPVYAVRTMSELLETGIAQRQFVMRLLAAFGGAAIGLALLGLYGVISYSVAQRTREIGIRMAIGARAADVSRLVLRQGLSLALAGMILGALAGLALARLIRTQLYGVAPFDPVTFAAVGGLMALTAAAAVYVPARRAARVDPIVALRSDG